jgi:group I intron endonuclease
MKSGIYKIVNIVNDKIYIGSSSALTSRNKEHFKNLEKGKHHSIIT